MFMLPECEKHHPVVYLISLGLAVNTFRFEVAWEKETAPGHNSAPQWK